MLNKYELASLRHYDEVIVTRYEGGRPVDKEGFVLSVGRDGLIDVRVFGDSLSRTTYHRRQVRLLGEHNG